MKIVVTELMHPTGLERLRAAHEVVYEPALFGREAELLAAAADADALVVRHRTQVRGPLLAAMARCRAVGRLGVGLDNIDVAGCQAKRIAVIPAVGANARSVAEYVLGSAMTLLRRSHYTVTDRLAQGDWAKPVVPEGREIGGKTLGIVGYGSIGRLTGELARRMDMRVLAFDPAPQAADVDCEFMPLDDLLRLSDVVSLHLPLLPATRHLIDKTRLALMRPGAVLVNAARGGIVVEADLAEALRSGRLHGAAIDVFEDEPLPAGSALAGVPHLLLTPHVAGVTADSEVRVTGLVVGRVLQALAG